MDYLRSKKVFVIGIAVIAGVIALNYFNLI
jgi:hypothetical protein